MRSLLLIAIGLSVANPLAAQRTTLHPTVVYAVSREPAMPIPWFTGNETPNEDVSDQLFLHLVTFAPGGRVSGDDAMRPALARAWHRVDSLTLIFDIDPRARWHDGTPVTAHDVVFTWQLMHQTGVRADISRLDDVAAVEPAGDNAVRVRFRHSSGEQVYTFGFLMQPLPSHLLERIPAASIPTSDFARAPVGNGPFRFVRRVPAQLVELRADSSFFLGKPTISRVVFRYVQDPIAATNLFLTGETDVLDAIPSSMMSQVRALPTARIVAVPSNDLMLLVFNTRSPADTSKPHAIFGDPRVREALALALDRLALARGAFDSTAVSPGAAQSSLWNWVSGGMGPAAKRDATRARTLLASAGWRDTDGDGILDKNGVPLRFTMLYPSTSEPRHVIAVQAQQMWRSIGVDAQLDRVEGPVFGARLPTAHWDVLIHRVRQDPTPSSLVQSWSCETARKPGSTNYARWCDSTFDRLLISASRAKDQPRAWRTALDRMESQHPAIFFAQSQIPIAVHRRYDNVIVWPSHTWLSLWQWRVRPEAALPRDR